VADRKDEQTQPATNYNAHIEDAPYVTLLPKKKPNVKQSVLGNFDASKHVVRRVYVDGNGKKVVLSRKLSGEEL
jgi:hypothetical protein